MPQRVKGQEASLIIVTAGVVEAELTDILNFNATLKLELLEQGYLGETTNRHDEIFNGASFSFEMHNHSKDFFIFAMAIMKRARRQQPDTVFNVISSFAFPNGDNPTWTFPDAKFGPVPLDMASRKDYLKVKVEGAVDEPDIQPEG